MNILGDWTSLVAVLSEADIGAIALDVRGTLIRPPRAENLRRAFTAAGVDAVWIADLDAVVPGRVLALFRDDARVIDWTLVTVCEAARFATENGHPLTSSQIEAAYQHVRYEYETCSVPLLTDALLESFAKGCQRLGVRVAVAADGPRGREERLLRSLFPAATSVFAGYFCSEDFSVNKLDASYYRKLAEACRLPPARMLVIGDRLDKDIQGALKAGCRAVLIGTDPAAPHCTPSMSAICPPPEPQVSAGLVLGRFQPFHLEHLRFVLAALARCRMLTIGVTNPFGGLLPEPGETRLTRSSNPLPFWLRKECIHAALDAEGIAPSRYQVHAVSLFADVLKVIVPPTTCCFTTVFDQWGVQKEDLLRQAGFTVTQLAVGTKSISGERVRQLMRSGSSEWRSLLPNSVADRYGSLLTDYVMAESNGV